MAVPAVGLAAHLNGLVAVSITKGAIWAVGCAVALFGVKHAIDVVGRERAIEPPPHEVPADIFEEELLLAKHNSEVYDCTSINSFTDADNCVEAPPPLSLAPNVPVSAIWGHPNTVAYTPAEPWNQALTIRVVSDRVEPINALSSALVIILFFGVLGWLLHKASRNRQNHAVVATKVAIASAPDHTSSIEALVLEPEALPYEPSTPTAFSSIRSFTDAPRLDLIEVTFEDGDRETSSSKVLQQHALQGHAPPQPSKKKAAFLQHLQQLESENQQLRNKTNSLYQQVQDLRGEKDHLTGTNNTLARKMEQLKDENEQLLKKNKIFFQLARERMDIKEKLDEELADAQDRANTTAELAKQLREQLDQANNEVKVNKEASRHREKEIDDLKCKLEDVKHKLGEYDLSHTAAAKATHGVNEMDTKSDLSAFQEQLEESKPGDQASEQYTENGKVQGKESMDAAIRSGQVIEAEKQKMGDDKGPIGHLKAQSNISIQQIQGQHGRLDGNASTEIIKEASALPEKPGNQPPAALKPTSAAATDRLRANAPHSSFLATETFQIQTQQKPLASQSSSEFKAQDATLDCEQVQTKTKPKVRPKPNPFMPRGTGLGHSRYTAATAKLKVKPPTSGPFVVNIQPPLPSETSTGQSNAPTATPPQAASVLAESNPQRWECTFCKCSYPISLHSFSHRMQCDVWHQKHVKNDDRNAEMAYPPNFQELATKPGPTADQAKWVRLNEQRISVLHNTMSQSPMVIGSQQSPAVPSNAGLNGAASVSTPKSATVSQSRPEDKEYSASNIDPEPKKMEMDGRPAGNDSGSTPKSPATPASTAAAHGLSSSKHVTVDDAQKSQQRKIKPLPRRRKPRMSSQVKNWSWSDEVENAERNQMG